MDLANVLWSLNDLKKKYNRTKEFKIDETKFTITGLGRHLNSWQLNTVTWAKPGALS